ncbi:ribosomal subunit interface protein [Candidatus Saccharibacteria bacterium HGW-Saccharibacteria-1]|jgi:putative sigma-54 modulation protein|nr:MAG: ribosomal subunit interface protein [Candidatus Saccharibacteria bacterium HGW-Saccharibacteria-1]
MITSIKVTGIAYEVDETTRKYVVKKVGRLSRYLPKHARKSVTADVKLTQVDHDFGNKYQAEIILNVPGKVITAKDSTSNMLAAVDIVDAKIQSQLREYKEMTVSHIGKRGVMGRFKRSFAREL